MKCAVIGSEGYIGKHLVYYLTNEGHKVTQYDIHDIEKDNYHKCDLTNTLSVGKIDLDVDYIFVFAGLTGTYAGFDRYNDYLNANEIGLLNLLDCIRHSEHRPHIVFPSSRLVYKGKEHELEETDEKEAKTIYAVNKIACEHILGAYYENFDIPYTIFRICVPFGNMLSQDYSFGTVGFFIKQSKNNGEITLYGGGKVKRTFTSMRDLCFQIVKCSLDVRSVAQAYNVGGITYSLHDAAMKVASKYGAVVRNVSFPEKDLRLESGSTFFSDKKIREIIGNIEYEDIDSVL
jgi:UDP-glucose 4-epimerase